jgi:predicted DNA-binding transcriptional regulator AlpA
MTNKQKTLLTRTDLAEMGISYSNSHLLKLEKDGLFPQRIYLSAQKVCWDLIEVNDWLEAQRARRGGVHHG